MLIYVDKKKEKRRKIKLFCTISFIIIFIGLNIFSYYNYLNHGKATLTDYQKIKYQNNWYDKTSPIHLFTNKDNNAINIILIPTAINRETALTLANTFANLPPHYYNLTFLTAMDDENFIRQIATFTLPQHNEGHPTAEIIITTDYLSIEELIKNNRLYPKTCNYAKAKHFQNESLNNLLDNRYPPMPEPQNKIEKEQQTLNTFASENKKELFELIFQNISPKFSKQSTFLKNVRLCLQRDDIIICQMQPNTSLLLGIKKTLKRFPKNIKPQKLLLLSSNEKINTTDLQYLKSDEGIYLYFRQRQMFLLPQQISALTNKKEPLAILKERAGLNPEYTSPQMELYKFNTTEVNLDEEI